MPTGFENIFDSDLRHGFYPIVGCECCKPKEGITTTATSDYHKWTKEEIEARIIELATELSKKKWYESKNWHKWQLKHWTEKLQRYNKAKEEFN